MVRILIFGSLRVWLYIQQLQVYKNNDIRNLMGEPRYICYFKFTEPTFAIFGELLVDENNLSKIFKSADEAEQFAKVYLEKKFHFRSDFYSLQ